MPKKVSKSIIASGKLQDELLALKLGVERSDQAIFITDKEGVILYINPAFEKIYGFKASEAIGKTPRILKSGKEPQKLYAEFWDTLLRKEIVNLELINKTKDGRFLNIKASANPIINEDNEIFGFLSIQSDITQQKELQMELSEAEKKYRDIVENSPDMIHSVDINGKIIFSNKSECDILGYSKDEIIGKTIYDIYSPDTWKEIKKGFETLKKIGRLYVPDGKMINKKGDFIDVEIDSIAIHNNDGDFVRTRSIIRDITERKKNQLALLESEEKFRLLMDHIPGVSIQGYYTDGTVFYWNKASEKVYGYKESEAIGKYLGDLIIPPELKPKFKEALKIGKNTTQSGEFMPSGELNLLHKKGHVVPVYSIHTAVVSGKNQTMLFCIDVDLSERKKTEEVLKKNEEKYRNVVENANEIILIAQEGMIKYVNPKMVEVIGFNQKELYSKPFAEFIHPEDRAMVEEKHIKRMKGEAVEPIYNFRIIDKAGIVKWLEIRAVLFTWEGRPATLNFMTDISERKLTEDELKMKIEQMEFMGRVNLKRYKKMLNMQKEIIELKKRLGEEAPSEGDLKEFATEEDDILNKS